MKYFYGMRLRGFSPGCQPMDGFLERKDSPSDKYYDVIVYNRYLSEDDEKHYSLTPLNVVEHSNNLGDDGFSIYDTYEEATDAIKSTLQFAYDEYSKTYPDAKVTWENEYLIFGNESEVYVPDSDCYEKCIHYSPVDRIKDYIERNHYPVKIGNINFVLQGVNMHDDADTAEFFPYSDTNTSLTFLERRNRAREEVETLTRNMTLEQAQDYFKEQTTDDNANFYGDYVYVYTKKKNPKYIFVGIRMD